MELKTELIQVVEQSGLEKTKGQKITETLSIFFDKAAEWQTTIESLTINSIEDIGKMKTAKEIRLSLKNKRLEGEKLVTAAREIVKQRMSDDVLEDKLWLKSGQIMKAVYDNLEGKAEWIEKYAERYEAEQKEIRKSERTLELTPYAEFVPFGIDLGNISAEDYTKLLNGSKMQYHAKIEAEQKAEAERLEAIRIENERIEKQRIENERLKAEAIEKEKQLAIEREKVEAEKKQIEEKAAKEKAELDAKLKEEREANEKMQAEIKAKEKKEEDARREEIRLKMEADKKANDELKAQKEAEEKAAKAPIKKQLSAWVDTFQIGKPITENETSKEIEIKFEAFKTWAKQLINN